MSDTPRRLVPLYALYGEETAVEDREFVHIEAIASRSSLYDWEIKPHAHGGLFQILVVSAGGVGVSMDDDVRPVMGPAVITVPPGTVHGFQMSPETEGMVISVSVDFLVARPNSPDGDVLFDVLHHPGVLDFSGSPGRFRAVQRLADSIMAEFRWPQMGRLVMFDALLRGLVVLLRRRMAAPTERDGARSHRRTVFTRFRGLVEQHFKDRWKVADYAAAMGVSESKLNRICTHFTGKTAFEVLQDRVLLEAQRYLIYTAAPVTQITYDLGFADPGYFCRYFKKRTGESPKGFRKSRSGESPKAFRQTRNGESPKGFRLARSG